MRNQDYTDNNYNVRWVQLPASMSDAVMWALHRYTNIHSRASRSEYWWWQLWCVIFGFGVYYLSLLTGLSFLPWLAGALLIMPTITLTVRRLHDTNRSGWWILLIPTIGGILLLMLWMTFPSDPYENDYGEIPNLVREDML